MSSNRRFEYKSP